MTTLKIGPNFGPDYADAADYEDVLEGDANNPVGFDIGAVGTGLYAPIVSKAANTGYLDLYIRHDHTDTIHNVKTFISKIGLLSTYTYGGSDTAQNDYDNLVALGAASDVSANAKNNGNGTSGGLWVDMNFLSDNSTRFDIANYTNAVKIYGKDNNGITFGSAYDIYADAMVMDVAGVETQATSRQTGKIGKEGDVGLGEAAHLKLRIYIPSSYNGAGGYIQGEFNVIYTEAA